MRSRFRPPARGPMLILPNIRSALEQLWANRLRSVLTGALEHL